VILIVFSVVSFLLPTLVAFLIKSLYSLDLCTISKSKVDIQLSIK
jgi:hypothetical protein